VEALSRRNSIRLFRLTATTEIAIARTEDYRDLITKLAAGSPDSNNVFGRYSDTLDMCTGVSVAHGTLVAALTSSASSNRSRTCDDIDSCDHPKPSKRAKFQFKAVFNADDDIAALLQEGFLRARESREHQTQAYWFAAPHLGPFTGSLVNGRAEMRTILRRARRKEVLLRDLSKKTMRRSHLGIRFHISDLVTRSEATEIATSSGPLIKLRI